MSKLRLVSPAQKLEPLQLTEMTLSVRTEFTESVAQKRNVGRCILDNTSDQIEILH